MHTNVVKSVKKQKFQFVCVRFVFAGDGSYRNHDNIMDQYYSCISSFSV